MFRFLQELEERLRDDAREGRLEEVLHLLKQGVNVDAADDEVRHVIPCHVCFTGGCVLWPKRYLHHPLPIYGITMPYKGGVRSEYFLTTPPVIMVCLLTGIY